MIIDVKKVSIDVRKRREELGITLRELSLKSGVSVSSINRLENEHVIKTETIEKIADALSLDIYDYINLKDERKSVKPKQEKTKFGEITICPKCREILSMKTKFCPNCGAKFTE